MLLKMVLSAYSRAVYSGRKMVLMNAEQILMKWHTQDNDVCYRSINDFRVEPTTSQLIQKAFVYFTLLLKEHDYIQDDALFLVLL